MSKFRTLLLAAIVCAASGMLASVANTAPIWNPGLKAVTENSSLVLVQACPRGYNYSYRAGRCLPADRYQGDGGYRGGYRAACPPGYDGRSGRCVPNNGYGGGYRRGYGDGYGGG